MRRRLHEHLAFLYGEEEAQQTLPRLWQRIAAFREERPQIDVQTAAGRVSERDVILITYGDMVQEEGEPPLRTLARFLEAHVADVVNSVHLLPFYPYSSDDGFAVIDYKQVDPALGDWEDVERVGRRFRLMFDAVINHISAESEWFQAFLRDEAPYDDYFVVVEPDADLDRVFRPRALPLLTPVQTAAGEKLVWTTFSADQIDLNFANPDVLLEVVDTLLFYVAHGAEFIRLDAIAFMWKEPGTSCIHLPQTHRIIQLLRAVLDAVAPGVVLITETNVPHAENVSYFGDGRNEAQMVYNFSLPPLTLHAFHTGSAATLSRWASTLATPSAQTCFLNFLASHDGIGLTPARGILAEEEVAAMARRVEALGGHVSFRSDGAGSQSPYELNVNFLDALGDPEAPAHDPETAARRFLASQAIMLALQGVPGVYFHSLFGSRNWRLGVQQTGRYRTINREKLRRERLKKELADRQSLRHLVLGGYRQLLQQRTAHSAFHPQGGQQILFLHEAVFTLARTSPDGRDALLCLHNVSGHPADVSVDLGQWEPYAGGRLRDLLTGGVYPPGPGARLDLSLPPYGVLWLTP